MMLVFLAISVVFLVYVVNVLRHIGLPEDTNR